MNNEEDINWFGMPKGKTKSKLNSNKPLNYFGNPKVGANVSFLGGNIKKLPQKINYFGFKTTKKYKMSASPLFRKESTKSKKLSRWGDADLDGSPNYFDCDPRKVFKDAKKGVMTAEQLSALYLEKTRPKRDAERMLQRIEEDAEPIPSNQLRGTEREKVLAQVKKKMRSPEVKKEMREARKAYRKERITEGLEKVVPGSSKLIKAMEEKRIKDKEVRKPYSELRIKKEKYKQAGEEFAKKEKEYERAKSQRELTPAEEETMKKLRADEKVRAESEQKISSLETRSKRIRDLMKGSGLQAGVDVATFVVEEKLAKGKKPTKKELSALAKAEKKVRKIGDIQSEGRISREILTKAPGGQIARVFTGAGVTKSGEYAPELKAKSARVRRMTKVAAGAIFGPSLTQTRFDSEPRGRGRPPGPSGEYRIGGRPVYESEFQQYAAKQNALNRILPSQQQSATLNPEYIAYMKAKQAAERGETQTVYTEDGMPMEGIPQAEQSEGLPTMGSSMMQTGQQQLEMQQKRAYQRATPDEVRAAQYRAQAVDNPLMAPNIMKGELKAAGGSILTPIGPSILEAPQVFKGEMRNVVKTNPDEGEVKLSERPQTNPYGDEWLDIEIGSGKPVIRKRPREKWMTGEAL
jgi:hypothetical protein